MRPGERSHEGPAGAKILALACLGNSASHCSIPDTTVVDHDAGVEAAASGGGGGGTSGPDVDAGVPNLIVNGDFANLGGWTFDKRTQRTNDSSYTLWSGIRETSDCGASAAPCYRVSYPINTMTNGSHFGEIGAKFEVPEAISYALKLRVRDDHSGGQPGFYFKQVLIDDKLIWEGDVASDGSDWELLLQDITPGLSGKSSATIALRVYLKASIHNSFGISVWWDDIVIVAGP